MKYISPLLNPDSGFTLAEVLIALTLLGVVAAFTIPKVLQAQADQRNISILKENYADMSRLLNEGLVSGEFTGLPLGSPQSNAEGNNHVDYFLNRYNAVQVCRTLAQAPQCRSVDNAWPQAQWIVTPAGGQIFISWINDNQINVSFDANGSAPPNTWGKDMLDLKMFYRDSTYDHYESGSYSVRPVRAGQIKLYVSNLHPPAQQAAEEALWKKITQ